MSRPPVIIAGQGICGSMLSWFLLQRSIPCLVYDPGHERSATRAASGIINPVTGKRLVKTWLADTLIPHATETYAALGKELGADLYDPMPIYKIAATIRELNDRSIRYDDPDYTQYISDSVDPAVMARLKPHAGGITITGGGRLDTGLYLALYRNYLRDKNMLIEEAFTIEQALSNKSMVIMCDGYQAMDKGLFTTLPWQLVKGEYLLVEIPDLRTKQIISAETTISPTRDPNTYYVGATYQWDYSDTEPTVERRVELIQALDRMLACPYRVLEHRAAIRPAVRDRRPFAGFHPLYPHIGILNGMGTKGISLAPYFAKQMADHIADGSPINDVADIHSLMQQV